MFKALRPSHDSLDVWSWHKNSPQDQKDNGLPASTPVDSSSRPPVTWECPSIRQSLLWSVTGCSGSHWYASKTWPHTSLGEDGWWLSDLYVFHDTDFSQAQYFPIGGNASHLSYSSEQSCCRMLLVKKDLIRCWKNNAQIKTFCNMRKCADAIYYHLFLLGSLSLISVTCNTKERLKKIWYQHDIALRMVIVWIRFIL